MAVEIVIGDCRVALRALPDDSVQSVVTSPPYFGLRDYGHAAQIGLELTPDAYLAEMVDVFREVRRVLRPDGTLWLNIGDSYAGTGRGGHAGGKSSLQGTADGQDNSRVARGSQLRAGLHASAVEGGALGRAWVPPPEGLKQKDMIGIPWAVAFALRADGWYLRQDIIWHKPNPMPESVRDRCTKAHEYVFLLSKSARYFFDPNAVAETGTGRPSNAHVSDKHIAAAAADPKMRTKANLHKIGGRATVNRRSVWTLPTQAFTGAHFATMPPQLAELCIRAGSRAGDTILDPFGGAGTTGLVACRLRRHAILVELNPSYAALARSRIDGDAPLFADDIE